jgi:DNA polymerase type B, organellar and viral
MSQRKQQTVKFPLSTTNERKVRTYYKKVSNLSANTSEQLVFNSLGIQARKTAYRVLGELYNIDIEKKNYALVVKRGITKTQKRENNKDSKNFLKSISNVIDINENIVKQKKKPIIKFEKLSPFIANWFKKNPNQMLSLKLGSTKADVILPLKFKCLAHFDNWLKRIIDEGTQLNSAGQMIEEDINTKKLFTDEVIIEDVKTISGGCNKHKAGDKKIKSSFYTYKLYNPCSMNNNCFFHCIQKITNLCINTVSIRKQFDIKTNTPISVVNAWQILKSLNLNDIEIIDYDTNEILSNDIKYILLKDDHFYVVESFDENNRKDKKTKRGLLTFDFETRQTEKFHLIKASNKKSYILKDTICGVYYRNYKDDVTNQLCLTTNNEKSSARQFIDWLNAKAKENKTYNILAHNGGKFDFYFFIASLTDKEILECDIHMRGTTVIGINYRGNLFKDSCCFITDSLSNISDSYKIEHGKITEMEIHGKTITSSQLCFYKPELSFESFMNLKNDDTEFWNQYVKYCLYDCIALYEIWTKFTECVNSLIYKISPFLLQKCPLMASSTIGSHSKKIIVETNKFKGITSSYKLGLEKFLGVHFDDKNIRNVDSEKYKFLCNFKRGGISHCNKMGKHTTGVVDVDIASQYPASLIYAYAPTGDSEWISEYNPVKKGFYLINNIVFKEDQQLFKPVAKSILNTSLNWGTNDFKELYIDSYMLDYVIKNHGLESFSVVKGLVSDREVLLSKIFGSYINTFFDEKKLQDLYKGSNDERYNPALRETIKLYTNSLTGKLVEDPSIHFSLEFNDESKKMINGVGVSKVFNTEKFNDWLVAGIMVYSYSKRLLFEYIDCLPERANSAIHVETDGIFFSLNDLDTFKKNLSNYEGEYPCKLGDDLGNLKIDKATKSGDIDYFLGKKFYQFGSTFRIKGIPKKTIDDYGNEIKLVDVALYESVYTGESIPKEFQTLRKSFFGTKTEISSHKLSRVIRPNGKYSVYE